MKFSASAFVCVLLTVCIGIAGASERVQVPGATVSARASNGWSHDLTLHIVRDEDGNAMEVSLDGWATSPELFAFPCRYVLPLDFVAKRHGAWEFAENSLAAMDKKHGQSLSISMASEGNARVTIDDERQTVVSLIVSSAYRDAVKELLGEGVGVPVQAYFLSLASVLEGTRADHPDSSALDCREAALDLCRKQCGEDRGARPCVRMMIHNAASGSISIECMTFAECCRVIGAGPL